LPVKIIGELFICNKVILDLPMSNLDDDARDAADKMQAGGKAAAKKMEDPGRDTNTEYNKEKVKEKVDNP
jgi:hypothetical protein